MSAAEWALLKFPMQHDVVRSAASSAATKNALYNSVSQPPGRGPVPGTGINYTGPREVLLEYVILVF